MRNSMLAIIVCLLLVACNKSGAQLKNAGLIGKWELTEYFYSPGDAGSWHLADASTKHTVEFRTDKSFECSGSGYNGAIGYNLLDSNKLELILPTQIPSTLECYYEIKDGGATLILSPVGCIEGCSNKYKAVQRAGINN